MATELVRHLAGRFVIVVGKGGVGKSTTAAALALQMADGGARTHLLSTDPAHSLADLFGRESPVSEPAPGACSPRLTLEELDATGRARRWIGEVREAVAEVVDRGTYLDREDVSGLLDRSLPGMDEVMAALRIGELAEDGDIDRVVVDTAPTGHALRLLDCGRTVRGWIAALGAMADKAAAVSVGLTGRRLRLAGERVFEDLARDVGRYEDGVLAEASFVVVTRPDRVVGAETGRLIGSLRDRGLSVAAVVGIGGPVDPGLAGSAPSFEVPATRDPVGCVALRAWGPGRPAAPSVPARASRGPRANDPLGPAPADDEGRHGGPAAASSPDTAASPAAGTPPAAAATSPAADEHPPGEVAAAFADFASREVLFFAGKGGVGKSTCAAAAAMALARERRVLLVSLDPAGSLGEVFCRPIGVEETSVAPGLRARQLDAGERFERFRERYRERIRTVFEGLGLGSGAALDRRVLESVLEMAPPGLDEIFALDAVLQGSGSHELLVLDTAPTGHFLRLMEMPATALSWTRAVLRILLRYRALLGLDDFAQDVLRLAQRLSGVIELLGDPVRSGVVVVTIDEVLPGQETGRLLRTLEVGGFPVAAVVRNRWRPGEAGFETEGLAGGSALRIRAPWIDPPPAGPARLLDFAGRWTEA